MTTAQQFSGFVQGNGSRLQYRDCGEIEPTLMFHAGMGSSAYIFC